MKTLIAAIIFAALPLTGCTSDLLDKHQAKISKQRAEQTRANLPQIYAAIGQASTAGALLILPAGGLSQRIQPADSPIQAAILASSPFEPGSACVYVRAYETAMLPTEYVCDELAAEAKAATALLARVGQIEVDLANNKDDAAKLRVLVAEYDDALTTSFKMGLVNSDLIHSQSRQIAQLSAYTNQSKGQLDQINKAINLLISDFDTNTKKIEEAIAKLPK